MADILTHQYFNEKILTPKHLFSKAAQFSLIPVIFPDLGKLMEQQGNS